MEAETYWRLRPHEYMEKFLSSGIRPDGRTAQSRRRVELKRGAISTADGSCQCSVGSTAVLTGIKLEVGAPSDVSSGNGELDVSVLLSPLCSPQFQLGRPTDFALAAAEFLTTSLTQTGMLDLSQLAITKGKTCWILRASVLCLNLDGNLLDAALLSLLGALQDLRLYHPIVAEDGSVSVDLAQYDPLKLNGIVVSSSFAQYKELMFSDPTSREESVSEGSLTIVCNGEGTICGLRKPGGRPLADSVLQECLSLSRARIPEVSALLAAL